MLAVGTALAMLAFVVLQQLENDRARQRFSETAQHTVDGLARRIAAQVDAIEAVRSFMTVSSRVDRKTFHEFVQGLLERHREFQALQWVPRVAASARTFVEETAQGDGIGDFLFKERDERGDLVAAGARPEYYPVYYVEPMQGNERALGFDLGSHPVRLAALAAARDSGRLVASGRVTLVQETTDQFAVVLVAPVYWYRLDAGKVHSFAARRSSLNGWAVGVLRIANLAAAVLSDAAAAESGIVISISDLSAPREQRLLYRSGGADLAMESGLALERTIQVGGRRWSIVAQEKSAAFRDRFPWMPAAAALAMLMIAAQLARHLHSLVLRAQVVQDTVEQRTRQLRETNLRLRAEAEERLRAEDSLREREAHTRAIVENASDGILTLDDSGRIETFNPAAERIFGYRTDEVIGKSIALLLPEPFREVDSDTVRNALTAGDFRRIGIGRDSTGLRHDGLPFPMELRLSPMIVGDKLMFTGVVRDITEHKQIELMKNEFISTVSHELRTPLTSIQGSLGLLRGGIAGELPAKARAMIDIGYNNCSRLVRLINDILDIEKIESGKIAYNFVGLRASSLLQQAIEANQGYADGFGVKLILRDESGDAGLRGDRDRLLQVITNLLGNAVKWSPPGAEVAVEVRRSGGSIRIAVVDRGPGIPVEFQRRIFSRFGQADSSDTRDKGGTGLGLNISKAIVEGHGGSIGFETECGQGTTFYFDLPAADGADAGSGVAAAVDPRGARILICEDNADIAIILQSAMAKTGYAADIARTAADAKMLLAKRLYSAMTLDIGLPDQDGLSLIRELRGQEGTKHLPIVIVSAREASQADRIDLRAFRVSDWLSKPVDTERLARAIERARQGATIASPRVLHIEDDPDVAAVISALVGRLADMTTVSTAAQARQRLAEQKFDLILLDLTLPDGRGEELLSLLPTSPNATTPVIIFSAQEAPREIAQRVCGALVKSRASSDDLCAMISTCIETPARAA